MPDTRGADDALDAQIGTALNAFIDARARGEPISEDAFLAAHPEHAPELREHLRVIGALRAVTEQLDGLIAQGVLTRPTKPGARAAFGPYDIYGVIGRGAVGLVLRGIDRSLGRPVALKLLRPEIAQDDLAVQRFVREARTAAALQHPNIVGIHSISAERGMQYIAMEYVDGPSLAQRIADGPLPPRLARHVFRELLNGLRAAHAIGLIHRDIKPANILLTWAPEGLTAGGDVETPDRPPPATSEVEFPRVKLADFGLARMRAAVTQLTAPDAVLGTPTYMSPEQARGAELDARSDLYSAGVVLYEMLAGQPPFRSDSTTATVHRILTAEVPPLPPAPRRADPVLARLALRLLAKVPAERLPSADAALAALNRTALLPAPGARRRARRRLILGAALMTALLGATHIWTRWRASDEFAPITAVECDPHRPRIVLARRGSSGALKPLITLPEAAGAASAAILADTGARGQRVIVVGAAASVGGACVFAYDEEGRARWQLSVDSPFAWPDCGPPTLWKCTAIAASNLDDQPGDELLVCAEDPYEYPSSLVLADSATGQVRARFYHYGSIFQVLPLPDYFGPGRPAIAALALNNKLDGFAQPLPGDDAPLTEYDMVSVLVILDPRHLDGVGPPRSRRLPLALGDAVWSYAMLDAPPFRAASYRPTTHDARRSPVAEEMLVLQHVHASPYRASSVDGPWLTVQIARPAPLSGAGLLTVNRSLEPVAFVRSSGEEAAVDLSYWAARWKIVVRAGRYVRERPDGSAAP